MKNEEYGELVNSYLKRSGIENIEVASDGYGYKVKISDVSRITATLQKNRNNDPFYIATMSINGGRICLEGDMAKLIFDKIKDFVDSHKYVSIAFMYIVMDSSFAVRSNALYEYDQAIKLIEALDAHYNHNVDCEVMASGFPFKTYREFIEGMHIRKIDKSTYDTIALGLGGTVVGIDWLDYLTNKTFKQV